MAKKSRDDQEALKKTAELLLGIFRNQREIIQELMRADSNVVSAIVQEMSTQARKRARVHQAPNPAPIPEGDTLYCSFCCKSEHEVKKLVAGPQVFICDECIVLCMDVIREEPADDPSKD